MLRPVLFFVLFAPCLGAHAGAYSDCILENMKGAATQAAVFAIKTACREKVLPHDPGKCIFCPVHFSESGKEEPFGSHNDCFAAPKCVEDCLNASYWSRYFGECAP